MDSGAMVWGLVKGWLQGLLIAWPFLVGLIAIHGTKFAFRLLEKKRLSRSGVDEIDRMDGRTFEKYLETLFERLGYRVELTRYVGDYGADLVVQKDGVKTVIQGKRYKNKVGVKGVQEAVAAKGYYSCQAAMVVTNSTYTEQAKVLARANDVTLWDRSQLVAALLSVRTEPVSVPMEVRPSRPPVVPVSPALSVPEAEVPPVPDRCVTCGKTVSAKVSAYCAGRAERFGCQVCCYDHQRLVLPAGTQCNDPRIEAKRRNRSSRAP